MSVSVIIPVHNQIEFLRSAVLSVIEESQQEPEIIVVDDGSTDQCLSTIRDLNVHIFRLSQQKGVSVARNEGIRRATGDFISFLDADDLMTRSSLRWRLDWLKDNPSYSAVAGLVDVMIDAKGQLIQRLAYPKPLIPSEPICHLTWDLIAQGARLTIPMTCIMMRRSLIRRVGYFSEDLKVGQDLDYFYRMLKMTTIPCFQQRVGAYRVHGKNRSISIDNGAYKMTPASHAVRLFINQIYGLDSSLSPASSPHCLRLPWR